MTIDLKNSKTILEGLGFTHIVVIAKDVSVKVVGSIDSAFHSHRDAEQHASYLSSLYRMENSFKVEALGDRLMPGDWVKTQDGEILYFRSFSCTESWGVFVDTPDSRGLEFRLPLIGLKKAPEEFIPEGYRPVGSFKPNTELYGRAISIYDANSDTDVVALGILMEILSPFTFLVNRTVWEIGQAEDLQIHDDGTLSLWNAVKVRET